MLDGATILVFADDWGIHPSSAQHLFRRFLARNRVVWFDTVGLRMPRLNLRDGRKVFRKLRRWAKIPSSPPDSRSPLSPWGRGDGGEGAGVARPLPPHPNLLPQGERERQNPEIHDIPLLPLQFGPLARVTNARILRHAVCACLGTAAGDRSPYVVTTLPLTADLPRFLPQATYIYYLVDDYTSWPGLNSALVRRMDREQTRAANLIVAASRELASIHEKEASRVEYLPHGVDAEHFAPARVIRARRKDEGEPPLADVVFFGALDERIDKQLFAAVIKARPEIRFLCVGPKPDFRLPDANNLDCREAVSYEELPAILGQCRAAILPYVRGNLGQRLAPLKALEALAAGLPIVATDVPELRSFLFGVYLGQTVAEIVLLLDQALSAQDQVPSLQDLAENSWEKRAECFSEMLLAARAAQGSS